MLLWSMWWDQTPTYKLSPSTRDGKNWQRLTQETLVSKSVDALASVLMCKSMTNDQVNWHAKKATNEATAEPISNNEAKLIMTSIDAMLTLMSIPQMPCINPGRTDVKLHTCGKKLTGFQTETTHRCHSVFCFESESRYHCRETAQHVF